jgi:N-acyl amino acid synthase of PEP-CTERM/exosortase system
MFDDYFEVYLADTLESKEIHYSIRYQVYCEEMGFENKDDFPMEQEFDEYDNNSEHFIVRHKQSGQWIGAMRLINKTNQLLPIEQHCFLNKSIDKKSVEVSRLCVIKGIRRRNSDTIPPYGLTEDNSEIKETEKIKLLHNHQRACRSIIWGLLNAGSEYCFENNITDWYSMTPTPLAKILQKGGFNMLKIGQPISHRGERFPFKNDVFETFHNEIWRKEFKNGYLKFSESKIFRKWEDKAA